MSNPPKRHKKIRRDWRPPEPKSPAEEVPQLPEGVYCTQIVTGKLFIAAKHREEQFSDVIMVAPYKERLSGSGKLEKTQGKMSMMKHDEFNRDFKIRREPFS